jgi:hypothetical protein
MNSNLRSVCFLLIVCIFILSACQSVTPQVRTSVKLLEEAPVQEITLLGPSTKAKAEISGMAWCGNQLILLPQYPGSFGGRDTGVVFSISKADIDAFLAGEMEEGINPELVPFDTAGVEQDIEGFEGFESIVFEGDRFYVMIEAKQSDGMLGYLVRGSVEEGCSRLNLDPVHYSLWINAQADLSNITDETLIYWRDHLYTIYEANGVNVNPDAVTHVFDPSFVSSYSVPMVNVEYRITDATTADTSGLFWAVNFFFPGDIYLDPAPDQIAQQYGIGLTHRQQDQVERLLAFVIEEDGIRLADRAPIYLELSGDEARNWEGIVRYEAGFLLVTDKYPTTILAYVENISTE